jgi:hypothetical protein
VGPDALYPGWSDLPAGSEFQVTNLLPQAVTLRFKEPDVPQAEAEAITLEPRESRVVRLSQTGIHQILLPDSTWRSILVAVHRSGDYRPEGLPRRATSRPP